MGLGPDALSASVRGLYVYKDARVGLLELGAHIFAGQKYSSSRNIIERGLIGCCFEISRASQSRLSRETSLRPSDTP